MARTGSIDGSPDAAQGDTADKAPISTERWCAAQVKEDEFWKRDGVLDDHMARVIERYGRVLSEISGGLPPDAKILDLGCGPTCAARLFDVGTKTYLDPLMDSYRETYADKLPEGNLLCATAEDIPRDDESYDLVLSVNALDHMIDPLRVLVEARRVLKKGGLFVLGIFTHHPAIAGLRRMVEAVLPFLREDAHPYSFTSRSARKLLSKVFTVERAVLVFRKSFEEHGVRFPSVHREDWMFICRK
jgi:SAM-dependent methyltransferase